MMMRYVITLILLLVPPITRAYIIPTGQFCPHRSEAWYNYMDHLDSVSRANEKYLQAKDILKTQEDFKTPLKLKRAAKRLNIFLKKWNRLKAFRQDATDYQLREFLAEPHLYNLQLARMEAKWIPVCQEMQQHFDTILEGYNQNEALKALWGLHKQHLDKDCPTISLPQEISALPFHREKYLSTAREVQLEYIELLNEHKDHIDEGSEFARLDTKDQQEYVNRLQKMEERWEIVFRRFQLMNGLNGEYIGQCQSWLAELGMDEDQYKQVHQSNLQKWMEGQEVPTYYRDLLKP